MLGTVGIASALLNQVQSVPPLMVTLLRLAFSSPFLIGLARYTAHRPSSSRFRVGWQDLPLLMAMALAMVCCQALFFVAIPFSSVTLVVVISLCSAPLIVSLLSILLFKERLTFKVIASLMLALAGTAFLASEGGSLRFKPEYLLGAGLALGSGFGYSSFVLLSKLATRRIKASSSQIIAWAFSLGTLMLLPFTFFTGNLELDLNWQVWLIAAYMGLVPTGLAYFLVQVALQSTTATAAAIITLLEPAVAALLAWLILSEPLTLLTGLGAGLLMLSVWLLSQRKPEA